MKKILFITALLTGFLGNAQDSTITTWSLKGRVFKSPWARFMTGAQIVDSLNLELGGTTWQSGGTATTDASLLTSGVLADGRVQQSNVTQHQAALSINKSQIPDFGSYINLSALIDDDAFATATASNVPSAESVKSYVDAIADNQTAAEVSNTPSGDISSTNVQAAINELDDEKVANTIAGRTGDAVSAVMIQDEADYIADGDPGTNEVVFCRGCAPMQVGTSATIDIDKYRGYDDRATDAATFTFDNLKAGAAVLIEINRASDATYSGVTIAHTTGAFAANTRQLVTIFVLPSGDVLRDYKNLE